MHVAPSALEITTRIREAGHQAYLVGGCVRDLLLGRTPKDWDVATDCTPDRLLTLLAGAEPIGAHFGVILWNGVEIATFRSDGEYWDGRHPAGVRFETDPKRDAERRDFTINGLFYDPEHDRILDFVGGRDDLASGIIRAIGDPDRRFQEDHLRMLRAVRFSARFSFPIAPDTASAIERNAGKIVHIAAERIRDELSRILTEGGARRGFECMDRVGLLREILPEIQAMQGVAQPPEYHPEGDVWIHTMLMLEALPPSPALALALGVLLHDVGKPPTFRIADRIRFDGHAEVGARMTVEILGRLKYPTALMEHVRALVSQHMQFMHVREMRESTLKRFLRQEVFPDLLELHRIDCASSHRRMESFEFCREALQAMPPERLHPQPLIDGRDVIEAGVPQGPEIGRILRMVEDGQLDGSIQSREQALALLREMRQQ
jgi:poly(A) polymerase